MCDIYFHKKVLYRETRHQKESRKQRPTEIHSKEEGETTVLSKENINLPLGNRVTYIPSKSEQIFWPSIPRSSMRTGHLEAAPAGSRSRAYCSL